MAEGIEKAEGQVLVKKVTTWSVNDSNEEEEVEELDVEGHWKNLGVAVRSISWEGDVSIHSGEWAF